MIEKIEGSIIEGDGFSFLKPDNKTPYKNIVICGNNGSGKTMILEKIKQNTRSRDSQTYVEQKSRIKTLPFKIFFSQGDVNFSAHLINTHIKSIEKEENIIFRFLIITIR